MDRLSVEISALPAMSRQTHEMVERKGLGHPDTICDLLAEEISRQLSAEYVKRFGLVLYHSIENAFLVAGRSRTSFGGGEITSPMRFVFGEHATGEAQGHTIAVGDIAVSAIRSWFSRHLPKIDPECDLIIQNELRVNSMPSLMLAEGCNDTCIGSGFAPLSDTERITVEMESYLNSEEFRARWPTGRDVKVTTLRQGEGAHILVSLAFLDHMVTSESHYRDLKRAIQAELMDFAATRSAALRDIRIDINSADLVGRGASGLYLTVSGTSAESADGGEVGRGNRCSGVNSFSRPLAAGAIAGKNPANGVGKIYNLFSQHLAAVIHRDVDKIDEAYVTMASAVGKPLGEPMFTSIRLALSPGGSSDHASYEAKTLVERELANMHEFVDSLIRDPQPVC